MLRTIKGKFIVGFFLIFSLSFLVLNHTVKNVIWSSNEKIVTSDLVELKKNSIVYVNQAFLINHYKLISPLKACICQKGSSILTAKLL